MKSYQDSFRITAMKKSLKASNSSSKIDKLHRLKILDTHSPDVGLNDNHRSHSHRSSEESRKSRQFQSSAQLPAIANILKQSTLYSTTNPLSVTKKHTRDFSMNSTTRSPFVIEEALSQYKKVMKSISNTLIKGQKTDSTLPEVEKQAVINTDNIDKFLFVNKREDKEKFKILELEKRLAAVESENEQLRKDNKQLLSTNRSLKKLIGNDVNRNAMANMDITKDFTYQLNDQIKNFDLPMDPNDFYASKDSLPSLDLNEELAALKRENQQIKVKLNRYKMIIDELVIEKKGKNEANGNYLDRADTSFDKSFDHSPSNTHRRVASISPIRNSNNNHTRRQENLKYDRLIELMQLVTNSTNYADIMHIILKDMKEIIGCNKSMFFILNKKLFETVFQKTKHPKVKHQKVLYDKHWIDICSLNENETSAPACQTMAEIKYGNKEPGQILFPIFSSMRKKEPVLALQLEDKIASDKYNKGFTFTDMTLLKFICKYLENKLDNLHISRLYESKSKELATILQLTASLASKKSMDSLVLEMKKKFSEFFGFNYVGVLVLEAERGDYLYTYAPTEGNEYDEIYNPMNLIKFPSRMGISGKALEQNSVIISNNPKKEPSYVPDIDNPTPDAAEAFNFIMIPLYHTGKAVGVLQLVNKSNGLEITKEDERKVKFLQDFIGFCIAGVVENATAANLILGVKQSLVGISRAVEKEEKERDDTIEAGVLPKLNSQVMVLKGMLNDFHK